MALPTGNGQNEVPALVKAFFYNQAAQFRYSQYQPALKEAQTILKIREDELERFWIPKELQERGRFKSSKQGNWPLKMI